MLVEKKEYILGNKPNLKAYRIHCSIDINFDIHKCMYRGTNTYERCGFFFHIKRMVSKLLKITLIKQISYLKISKMWREEFEFTLCIYNL